ncbi:hypothetical protein [Geitlerinema sp. PCC 9228]|jgi:hypothetical protein|uniref:hypothetical protein n=1 Tax=Geitlerinema sp. PCC 9228 TaxID=111611 RepID=UPI000A0365EB|nr:hypothetical protein [Geitlerinema sp. PCC 9228]
MKGKIVLLGLLFGTYGCTALPSATNFKLATPAASERMRQPQSLTQTQPISTRGIGVAKLGMTLGELKQIMGPSAKFRVVPDFQGDFDAIAVLQAGNLQFYILYLSGNSFTNRDRIQFLMTDNPRYQTAEGVGPQTLLRHAVSKYGEATLSYTLNGESRESVVFSEYQKPEILFTPATPDHQLAGIYPNAPKEVASRLNFYETNEFHRNAYIQSVLVSCADPQCSS